MLVPALSNRTVATINLPIIPEQLRSSLRAWIISYRDTTRPDQPWTVRRIPYTGQSTAVLSGLTLPSIDIRATADYYGGATAESSVVSVVVYVPSTIIPTIPTTTVLLKCPPLPTDVSRLVLYSNSRNDLILGTTATVICANGFQASERFSRLVCGADGTFSGEILDCAREEVKPLVFFRFF